MDNLLEQVRRNCSDNCSSVAAPLSSQPLPPGGFTTDQTSATAAPPSAIRPYGTLLLAYFTPLILVLGVAGNCLSFAVFASKTMRKSPASIYLAALSMADTSTLLFYVLREWLKRGLPHLGSPGYRLEFLEYSGFCHGLLFLGYVSRLMSAWIIVLFTIERFTGICYPMKRFKSRAKRIILLMLCMACVLVTYKPVMSGSYTVRGHTVCASNPSLYFASFVLDSIYGISITMAPFLIITVLNFLIVRKLFLRNRRQSVILTEDTRIKKVKLEFTFILLAISVFFIAFNLPFFVVWSRMSLSTTSRQEQAYWEEILNTTRTIFYMNYCINFFLYSITGARFRAELCQLVGCCCCAQQKNRKFKNSYIRSMRFGSSFTQGTMMSCSSSTHFTTLHGTPSVCTTYSA